MKQYLLSIYQPEGPVPPPEKLEPIMTGLTQLETDMREAGVWVFTAGLHEPGTATVLRAEDDEVLLTDGPFAEGKEHVGGFTVIQAPDLDAALQWAGRMARIVTLPVEVRPILGEA